MFTNHIKSTAIAIIAIFACAINASAQLYLIGDAVGGWSLDNIENNMMSKDGNIYTWAGHLNEGELKFLTKKDWLPSWGPSTDRTEIKEGTISCDIKYRSTDSEGDNKFKVTEAGFYRIKLNLNGGYTKADITSYPAAVYPFGTGTSDGYAVEMRETSFGSGEYKGNRISLKNNGKLVFLKQQGDGDYYGPATDGIALSAAEERMTEYTKLRNVKLAANLLTLNTDKACYKPGETVTFTSSVPAGTYDGLKIRYRHLGNTIDEQDLTSQSWTWTAPAGDYKGYMAEIYTTDGKTDVIHGTIAIDVSSDWKMFPRYGFIATFNENKTTNVIADEMAWLNRCHINGVQFQDWHYSHHHPCPPFNSDGSIYEYFQDISNRYPWNSTTVIRNYIDKQHSYGMKSIFYNLAFGALNDAENHPAATDGISGTLKNGYHSYSGVGSTWYLYKGDSNGRKEPLEIDKHGLPSGWKSDIYLVNPGNQDWINYMNLRNEEVYNNFNFDGFQIDQLGDRGWLFDNNGRHCYLPDKYADFINGMHSQRPEKELIMNSVSRYGAMEIMQTGKMSFAYNETWGDYNSDPKSGGNCGFNHLYQIIRDNKAWGGNNMQTVFAAYMNYSKNDGYFNTPGVLLTDAVIFALGGAHLELGHKNHMLCHEYFPFDNVKMDEDLQKAIIHYYDFHTAYENLLRGGGSEESLNISGNNIQGWTTGEWAPAFEKINTYGKKVGNQHVVHLLNFNSYKYEYSIRDKNEDESLEPCIFPVWRDYKGELPAPTEVKNLPVTVETTDTIHRVWVASPDYNAGAMQQLKFTQQGNSVTFTVPSLNYWTMIVME